MKKITIFLICIVIIVTVVFFIKKETAIDDTNKYAGAYYTWQPLTFTYKQYQGTPHMDEPAFEAISKHKQDAGMCQVNKRVYYTFTVEELEKILESTPDDTDALFEMFRKTNHYDTKDERDKIIQSQQYSYLLKAAELGHITANIEKIYIETNEKNHRQKIAELDKYIKITPEALIVKIALLAQSGYEVDRENNELLQAGYYPYANLVTAFEKNIGDAIKRDLFCEAYYNGCAFNNLKQKYDIKCGGD